MYCLPEHRGEAMNYKEIPVFARSHSLMLMKNSGYKNVVYLFPQLNTTTFRYRVYNMCEALETSLKWHGTFFVDHELDLVERYIDYIDLFVIVRYEYSETLERIMEEAKLRQIHLIYDVDDLIFHPKYQSQIMETILSGAPTKKDKENWRWITEHQFKTAQKCDGYIATNSFLIECMSQEFNGKGRVISNFYNREQEKISEYYLMNHCYDQKIFEIGYFSGSATHEKDFAIIENELLEWMYDYPDTVLKIVGYKQLSEPFLELEKMGRIVRKPIMDYVRLQREIAECDLNLIPLEDNCFTNCKSELKYFEAAIAGTISIASPVFVYKKCITDGVNGFLADGNWYKKIEEYYSMPVSKKDEMRYTALKMAGNNYNYRLYTERIESILDEFTNDRK